MSKLQNPVCLTCKDGPRCEVTNLTKTGLELPDGSPCANSTVKHPEIKVIVSSVQLYRAEIACSAHPEAGGGVSRKHKESFNTNITN